MDRRPGGGGKCPRLFPVRRNKGWCGRRESNPHGALRPDGFSYPATAFAALAKVPKAPGPVWGLDYPFTMSRRQPGAGAARLVSTPSRRKMRSAGAWLGIPTPAVSGSGFPEFGQFYIAGFPAGTQVIGSSPLRLPFRHARVVIVIYSTPCWRNQAEFGRL